MCRLLGWVSRTPMTARDVLAAFRRLSRLHVDGSTGFVPPSADGWQVLPNDTVLVIDRDSLVTRQVALGSGLGAHSTTGVAHGAA